jgi:hypothetical protein
MRRTVDFDVDKAGQAVVEPLAQLSNGRRRVDASRRLHQLGRRRFQGGEGIQQLVEFGA